MTHLPSPRVRVAWGRLAPVLVSLATAASLPVATGCGLINSDLATVTFDLPPKTYTFDTSQADWKGPTSNVFTMVPTIGCTSDADCCPPAVTAAGIDCTTTMLVCDVPAGSCAVRVDVQSPVQVIDLKNEANLPSSLANQSVLDITVKKLSYDVGANSLNIDLPAVDLYLAPQGTTDWRDPNALLFATVPPIPHGTTLTDGNIPIKPAANTAFENIGMHLGTPFAFLAHTQVLVPGGTPAPSGALTITIKGQLAAKPNL